ncbi:hypothetical protein P170DRAFT_508578 [Aspergillus steynii IBT 23096]|uniref:F-box domain-containing protein n=1 Tax=Aspergillus steynii IBT 23096 TaxID=1392250 RepID=A0A2I2GBY2_9EURO|nr:uncharacterized protein P170DRAFT_508578 [Aspergillus steynii IBT 23096]PLB50390.1 hypothetical protein P170DRAFT_508578 [Aspergillus steynii IBT 23096]
MVSRGIWNVHINGKWYRSYDLRGRISPPDIEPTFRMIKQICGQPWYEPDRLEEWEPIPFRTPIHSNLNYVYTIDMDAGLFIISLRQEFEDTLRPAAICIDLATLCASDHLLIEHSLEQREYMALGNTCQRRPTPDQRPVFGSLDIDPAIPTPMNELQERFFTDFVFMWRFYIDDPFTWRYDCPVFRVLAIAFLRLAAWDFELSHKGTLELPITFTSIPSWGYPKADTYWFHGFLVVLHENIETNPIINEALEIAKPHLDDYKGRDVRLVLISPQHVAFAEISRDFISVSQSIALLTNSSALRCSPGFRALIRILTSDRWTKTLAARESSEVHIPPEVLHNILNELKPRDTVAFAQASLSFKRCYYASVPQFKDTAVLRFHSSVPCCGMRGGLDEDGICCRRCYTWRHAKCVDVKDWSSTEQYVCVDCREGKHPTALVPGQLNRVSCRVDREIYSIRVGGSEKTLHHRLTKPTHLRKELWFMRNTKPLPPCFIDYTVLFNGSFSGLAYGLGDGV